MAVSPFNFGTTVSSISFTNRTEEIKHLKQNFLSGVNTILISPRRWGKSSLVERVINELQESHKSLKIVKLDFFTVGSEEEMLEDFARGVLQASHNTWQEWWRQAGDLLKRLSPKLELSPDPSQSVSLSLDWQAIQQHPGDILALPEKLAQKLGVSFLICIDEFQNMATLPEADRIEKLLRSYWQKQKHVTYCLYGSKRHMMSDIFNSNSRAFYRFGDVLWLQKIEGEHWATYIETSFAGAGKSILPEAATFIAAVMENHPWYVQQLAHYTFFMTKKKATKVEVMQALNELITANTPFYEKQAELLSNTQINLIKALVGGETQLTATAVMQQYKLGTPRNVQKNRETLEKQDIIDKQGDAWVLLDPGFSRWFKWRYLGMDPLKIDVDYRET